MSSRARNCFLSYHHDDDQQFTHELRDRIRRMRVSDYSLKEDISHLDEDLIYRLVREKMRRCSVTVVLIGARTGHRKWVDWEMWSSLRSYRNTREPHRSFRPNGLLGIYLPTKRHSIPPRLQDNLESGYATCIEWKEVPRHLEKAVNLAYDHRFSRAEFIVNNRPLLDRDYFDLMGLRL